MEDEERSPREDGGERAPREDGASTSREDGARSSREDGGERAPREDGARSPREDFAPAGVPRGTSSFHTLKRTFTEFVEDNLSDSAAALTYYGLLAVFPALIALISVVGLVGNPTTITKELTEIVAKIGSPASAQNLSGPIKSITAHKSASGVLLIVGIVGALYSASSYVAAFARASNIIFETPEGRPAWKLRPLQMLVTLVMLLLLVAVALALILTGPIVTAVAGPLGVGGTAVSIWNIAKWPVLILFMVIMFTVLYFASPNVRLRGVRSVMPGAIFALAVWGIASAAFAIYVAHFGSYDKTYGTLGGIVAFLVWMWITNSALLLGSELNAEKERTRELRAGIPGAERELQLDARAKPKQPHTT
ncbi:MAG TPA: YihY/virulence factor BrkB family protein [Solirubrobacteraceae bacterium]|jgi:membrane protein|nr:YihY/virulence factor BrkB family protein [Solirubrobacteraceae bacterium]